jgi:hypothetical protein
LQEPQLHNDEEQEEAYRADGNKEILQYVPQANGAQGSEVVFVFAGLGWFSVSTAEVAKERGGGKRELGLEPDKEV